MTSDKSQIHTPTPVNTKEAKTTNVRRNQADFYSSWAQKATKSRTVAVRYFFWFFFQKTGVPKTGLPSEKGVFFL